MTRLQIRITGVVQGVGYRYFVVSRARAAQVTGWVKNRADGTVEIEAVGERGALDGFLRYVRVGPPAAHVYGVETHWFDDDHRYESFDVRF